MESRCKLMAITLLGILQVLFTTGKPSMEAKARTSSEIEPVFNTVDQSKSESSDLSRSIFPETKLSFHESNVASSELEKVPSLAVVTRPTLDYTRLRDSLDSVCLETDHFDETIENEAREKNQNEDITIFSHTMSQLSQLKPMRALKARLVQATRKKHLQARLRLLRTLSEGYLDLSEGRPSLAMGSLERAKALHQTICILKPKDRKVDFTHNQDYMTALSQLTAAREACERSRTISGIREGLGHLELTRKHMETQWSEADSAMKSNKILNRLTPASDEKYRQKAIEAATAALLSEAEGYERLMKKGPDFYELPVHTRTVKDLQIKAERTREKITDSQLARIDLSEEKNYQDAKRKLERAQKAWKSHDQARRSGVKERQAQVSRSGAQGDQAETSYSGAPEIQAQASHAGAQTSHSEAQEIQVHTSNPEAQESHSKETDIQESHAQVNQPVV